MSRGGGVVRGVGGSSSLVVVVSSCGQLVCVVGGGVRGRSGWLVALWRSGVVVGE